MPSSWRELQNTAGRAGTAGPPPAQFCHGAGIRQEVSEALERAGREEDAVGRAKPVVTLEGHTVAARAWQKGRWHHGLLLGVALGITPEASQGMPHTDTGKSNPHIPCALQTTHCPQDRALEKWCELHADPPYHLPQGNQYILTSNSHIPGGCYGWGGGGRTESKQQQQEQS